GQKYRIACAILYTIGYSRMDRKREKNDLLRPEIDRKQRALPHARHVLPSIPCRPVSYLYCETPSGRYTPRSKPFPRPGRLYVRWFCPNPAAMRAFFLLPPAKSVIIFQCPKI